MCPHALHIAPHCTEIPPHYILSHSAALYNALERKGVFLRNFSRVKAPAYKGYRSHLSGVVPLHICLCPSSTLSSTQPGLSSYQCTTLGSGPPCSHFWGRSFHFCLLSYLNQLSNFYNIYGRSDYRTVRYVLQDFGFPSTQELMLSSCNGTIGVQDFAICAALDVQYYAM